MLAYETLSTEKYWIKSVKQELKGYRREANKAAFRSLLQFLFASAMIIFVMFAVETMSIWLPVVTDKLAIASEQVAVFIERSQLFIESARS